MCSVLLFISGSEIVIILVVAWFLLGSKKLPEIARMLGKGLREVRKATDDLKKEINRSEVGDMMKQVNHLEEEVKKDVSKVTDLVTRPVETTAEALESDVRHVETAVETLEREARDMASYTKYYAQADEVPSGNISTEDAILEGGVKDSTTGQEGGKPTSSEADRFTSPEASKVASPETEVVRHNPESQTPHPQSV